MPDTSFKIDIHTHILPKNWPDLQEKYGYGGWVKLDHHKPGCAKMLVDGNVFREVEENIWEPGVRIAQCDRHGVTVQVISTVPVMFSYWAKPDHAMDLSKMLNDHIASVVAEHPERFAVRERDLRRVNLERFPYHFLFRIAADRVRILVVRHHRRRTTLGMPRL